MGKSRSFSIYLLKDGFDASNALKEDHSLNASVDASNLPPGSTLYLLDSSPMPPWWKNYFGITEALHQVLKGAILFLPIEHKCFALTFGHTYHNLREDSFEYDFGLKVTLNSLDPKKLRSTDTLEPGAARRQRTQTPMESDLTYFDFDRDSSILKGLTGKVRSEYEEYFKHATGASNLRVSTPVDSSGLAGVCKKVLEIYHKEDYRRSFPDVRNIEPVRDPSVIARCEVALLQAFKDKDSKLTLTVPALINYQDDLAISFSGAGAGLLYEDVSMLHYHDYLLKNGRDLTDVTIDQFKTHSLYLCDENGSKRDSFTVHKCMIFDASLDGDDRAYHLCDGNWYMVDREYMAELASFLDPHFGAAPPAFTPYRHEIHKKEAGYNEAIAKNEKAYICLDGKSISPRGQTQVEPCDLYTAANGQAIYHHVKISTRSSTLSHLFNQGLSSLELVKLQQVVRDRLCSLIRANLTGNDEKAYISPIEDDSHKVIYVIVTHKGHERKSANLPLFSRISLRRTIRSLKLMGVDASVCFVEDASERSKGKRKPRKSRKSN